MCTRDGEVWSRCASICAKLKCLSNGVNEVRSLFKSLQTLKMKSLKQKSGLPFATERRNKRAQSSKGMNYNEADASNGNAVSDYCHRIHLGPPRIRPAKIRKWPWQASRMKRVEADGNRYASVTHAYHESTIRGRIEGLAIQMHQFHGSSDKTTRFMPSSCMNQQPFPYLHNNA